MQIPTVNRCENIKCDKSDQCEQSLVCAPSGFCENLDHLNLSSQEQEPLDNQNNHIVTVIVITFVVVLGFVGLGLILFRIMIVYQRNIHVQISPTLNNRQQTNIALGEAANETDIDVFNSV